jgi:hypothetical protein
MNNNPAESNPCIRSVMLPIIFIAALAAFWVFVSAGTSQRVYAAPGAVGSGTGSNAAALTGNGKIVFNRDIRPILADRCFSCHGPDPNKRQAGLRLDRPEAALGVLPKHPKLRAFVPGDPDHSEALVRILSADPVAVMPPSTSHLKLSDKEKSLIRQWVTEGEPYQEHWAFTAPVRPPLPAVQNTAWPKNEIDRFVLANLESKGLSPSKQADKATLIRRVSLDLTGIPPTPAEVDAFVADNSANAYEKVVDRLLASPHYGEQMATTWLDYARYADSHGYQSDPERHMWRWRDWVINAYNNNMPFDQFAVEQLAGDLLPNATLDQKIATGFNRNHRINDEGGIIDEEWRVEGVIDRVSTTSAVFLGLTMECCRCHDHKYDPITQKEFYAFSAYFNSVNELGTGPTGPTDKGINVPPILKLPTPDQQKQLDKFAADTADLEADIAAVQEVIPDRVAALDQPGVGLVDPAGLIAEMKLNGKLDLVSATEQPMATQPISTQPISTQPISTQPFASTQPTELKFVGNGEPQFVEGVDGKDSKAIHFDGSGNAVDAGQLIDFSNKDAFTYGAWIKRTGNGAFVSKMDSKADFRGFDLYIDGDRAAVHIINHWPDNALKVRTNAVVPKNKWIHVMAAYDGSGKAAGIRIYFNGVARPTTILNDALTDSITTKSPVLIGRRDGSDNFNGDVADVRFYSRALSGGEVGIIARGKGIRAILQIPPDQRTADQTKQLTEFVEATDPDLSKDVDQLNAIQAQKEMLTQSMPDTMVMEELPRPRDTFVLLRGEYDKHGDKVQPGVPAVLPPLPKDAPPNRLGLAKWIVDPANPLTARVQVNRLWEKFFGVGIVKTSENLGTQSEWPSNPELLDWLASEFVRLNWDMKAIQKEMVMSAAYQQSSEVTPAMVEADPENRWIERGPRFRLSAEQVRDQALAASGLLVEKIGGPSSRPYEPADLWAGNSFGNLAKYVDDKGDGLYRRTLYTFIKRTAVPANLSLFDQPSREYCVIRRSRTDTPLQALDLMNDPQYLEASRVMAQHLMQEPGTPADRITSAFKRVTCRIPTDAELKILLEGFSRDLARFQKDPQAATKLVSVGASPRDAKLNESELAAYTMATSIILNLDETVTRQ